MPRQRPAASVHIHLHASGGPVFDDSDRFGSQHVHCLGRHWSAAYPSAMLENVRFAETTLLSAAALLRFIDSPSCSDLIFRTAILIAAARLARSPKRRTAKGRER
jgi:hypothetical protein